MKARLIAREAPILHLELTDCDSLAFSQAKNIFGSKGKIIAALLDLCMLVGENKTKFWNDPPRSLVVISYISYCFENMHSSLNLK